MHLFVNYKKHASMHLQKFISIEEQKNIVSQLRGTIKTNPLYVPQTPSGKSYSIQMTNFGSLGWLPNYTYGDRHPVTDQPWPAIPDSIIELVDRLKRKDHISHEFQPQAMLLNVYKPDSKLGLHQDKDELNKEAPIVSLSFGESATFLLGGMKRQDPTREIRLESGDAFILANENRMRFHGVKCILPNTAPADLMKKTVRINLTLRQVN